MKAIALLTAVGCAALGSARAGAQDIDLGIVFFQSTLNNFVVDAVFWGDLPAGATSIASIWSDVSIRLTGDAPITITGWNAGYDSLVFGPPQITGNGTTDVSIVAVAPGSGLGTPDPSNPLAVLDFTYAGNQRLLRGELVGQNAALFRGVPGQPFGTPVLYQDAQGNPGPLRAEFIYPPAPGTIALVPVALVAARRRR